MSENKRVTIPFLEKVLKPIVDLVKTKADKTDILQSDWEQTDETKIDFIKNKPEDATDDDVIAMMQEIDAFPVVMDENGDIMTDEDGAILLN